MTLPHSSAAGFVGRPRELEALYSAVSALGGGSGSVALIGGESGIGKTRLATEIAARAAEHGMRVVWSRCHEAEGRPPYWAWVQIVQSLVFALGADTVGAGLGPDGQPLGQLVPELRPSYGRSAPADAAESESESARFVLFQAMAALLRRVSESAPLLLVLDDLHWSDLPSLLLLDFLAHDLSSMPVLVVGTHRDVEVRRRPEVEAVLGRIGRRGQSIALTGFTVDEAARFVELSTGQSVPATIVQRLHRDTNGHPFFLDEVVRLFRGAGSWFNPDGAGLPLSQGVRAAIHQRLAPLPAATRDVLTAAAVAGRVFDLPLLESGTDTARGTLLATLGPALEIEVVAALDGRPGCYRFAHDLIRQAIYDDLAPATRTALHGRFGACLETRDQAAGERLAEIAHHFFQASPGGDVEKAIDYAERAGRQAAQTLAYEEAAEHFARALHLIDLHGGAPTRHIELMLALGEAKNRAGSGEDAAQVFRLAAEAARRHRAPDLLARAAIGLSDIANAWPEYGRSDHELIQLLREALQALDSEAGALRARVMARLATELAWDAPLAELDALSRDAVERARRSGDRGALAYALLARIQCLYTPDDVDERLRLGAEVLALSGGRGEAAVSALLWRLGDMLHLGRMADVDVCRDALIHAVRELRQPGDLWLEPAVRSQKALQAGRFAEAESLVGPILAEPRPPASARQAASSLLFLAQREQGRHDGLAAGLKAFALQSPHVLLWKAALAMLHAEMGAADEMLAEIDAVAGDGFGALRRDRTWLFSLGCLAEACHRGDVAERAAELYEILLPYEGRNAIAGPAYYLGPVSYYLGILASSAGRLPIAERHLERALAAARAMGARPFVARILLAMARVRVASDPRQAAELQAEGDAMARELGMAALASPAAVDDASSRSDLTSGTDATALTATLAREGDIWTTSYGGRTARMKALKGFAYLAMLVDEPGREFHVLDLVAREHPAPERGGAPSERGGAASDRGYDDLGPTLDARAKAELQARVRDLRQTADEAEADNDLERARRARDEIERIADELGRAVGLGGRDRTSGSAAERARASVTKAIRASIRSIADQDPALADLLTRTVRTGAFCSYEPIAEFPVTWTVKLG